MTLALELSPEESARLEAASRFHGTDPATYAKQLVTEHLTLGERFRALSNEEWDRLVEETPPAHSGTAIPEELLRREYLYGDRL